MNLRSRYGLSLSAISLVVCPLFVSVVTLPEVVFGAEVQELRSQLGLVAQATSERKVEADKLSEQGLRQYQASQYQEAIQVWERSLQIYREITDRSSEGKTLGNLGAAYASFGKHEKAIEYFLQSLVVTRELKDRPVEAQAIRNLGGTYYSLGKYQEAIEYFLQSLTIQRELRDQQGEINTLKRLGEAYELIYKYDKAIDYYLQSLAISRTLKDRRSELYMLIRLGISHELTSNYEKALEYFLQGLKISQELRDRRNEASSLDSLGITYFSLGKYDKAIDYYLQSLLITQDLQDRRGEGVTLGNLSNVYLALGRYDKAIELQMQSLAIKREIRDRASEGTSLNNLGSAYLALSKNDKAIEYFLQGLEIAKEIKDTQEEGRALGNLGNAYLSLSKYNKAIEYYLQSLEIKRKLKDRQGEGAVLRNLGAVYSRLNRDREAMIFAQQGLTIAKEISDRRGEGFALANLGVLLSKARSPELAILFFKQSINVSEAIRKGISKLDKDIQKSYLATVEDTYRNLADLLLKQDRILEAQQVLDLLKVEELSEYLKNVRGNDQTAQGVDLQSSEQNIIAFGNELAVLQQLDKLTPAQEQRLSELTNNEINRNEQFNAFLKTPLIQKQLKELQRIENAENVDIAKFNRLRSNLLKVKNAVILYPLILEDRLELIIITANTPPIRKTTKIKREQLNTAIAGFLSNLRNPSSANVEKDAQQLYEWIIKPFEAELQQANIQTIIYAPDGQLRYIPLAALHDGKQWLVEKYRINNITASSLTDFTPRDYSQLPSVLAAAATNSHNIKFGDRSIPFGALPATKTEVEAIATLLPKTTTLIDQQFSKNVTLQEMKRNTIIHLATHGYFAVGRAEDSFIIFGDGDKATLTDIANWSLTNVSLVVLSACETAIGGKLGSGVEILGLGYRIQDAGAGAAIASLWKVSDDGTSELMQKLYKNLSQKNVSSSEALRQAQIAMIRSNKKATSSDRANIRIVGTVPTNQETQLSHPFYWSAFILIGNGF